MRTLIILALAALVMIRPDLLGVGWFALAAVSVDYALDEAAKVRSALVDLAASGEALALQYSEDLMVEECLGSGSATIG